MQTLLTLVIGLIFGYVSGYSWKSANPTRKEYDFLVYVTYPITGILFIIVKLLIK